MGRAPPFGTALSPSVEPASGLAGSAASIAGAAHWVCPRCHIPLRYPMALCSPCGRFGNGSARFPDDKIERAEADLHTNRPVRAA